MNGKIKIVLLDFNDRAFTLYADGRAELNDVLTKLGKTKWKATSIRTIKE